MAQSVGALGELGARAPRSLGCSWLASCLFGGSEPFLVLFFRDFKIEDGKAVIPLGITVQGDVLIIIYHARSTLGGRLQAKVRGGSGPLGRQPVGHEAEGP